MSELADEIRRKLRRRALHIPSDIWESATADDDGAARLSPLLAGLLAIMEYEWAWGDALCAP